MPRCDLVALLRDGPAEASDLGRTGVVLKITPEFSNELGSQLRVLDQPAAVMIHGVHHRVLVAARGEVVLDVPYAATAGVWELSRCSKNDVGTRSQRVPITNEPLVFLRDFVVGGAARRACLPTSSSTSEAWPR